MVCQPTNKIYFALCINMRSCESFSYKLRVIEREASSVIDVFQRVATQNWLPTVWKALLKHSIEWESSIGAYWKRQHKIWESLLSSLLLCIGEKTEKITTSNGDLTWRFNDAMISWNIENSFYDCKFKINLFNKIVKLASDRLRCANM